MSELLEALGVRGGIVCAVGAGGKKTTLYRIADDWSGPYALTATVFSAPPPRRLWDERVLAEADDLADAVAAAAGHRRLAYALASDKPGRVGGVPPALIPDLHHRTGRGLTLVKADGARMRGIKAPRDGEPIIPPGTDLVLHLTSAGVLGRTLDEDTAHRPEQLAAVTGAAPGETLTPTHLARLLCSADGALKGTEGTRLVAVINQVDDAARHAGALEAARMAVAAGGPERVVLTSMRAAHPVVEVVEKHSAAQTDGERGDSTA